jgi:hypothetical protein
VGESFWPAGVFVHSPKKPGTLHCVHVLPQALLQHTPSLHMPLRHSPGPCMHGCPLSLRQVPAPLQLLEPVQFGASSSPASVLEQVPTKPGTLHCLQSPAHEVWQQTPSTQKLLRQSPAAGLHGVPISFLHRPLPLQLTSPEHEGTSSAPEGTKAHVPTCPLTLHALQASVQPVSQQTPSTQFPLKHSVVAKHAVPFSFFDWHDDIEQYAFIEQCASFVHVCSHALSAASQAKFPQFSMAAGAHVPLPSQPLAFVKIEPLHEAAAHVEPEAYFWQELAPLHQPLKPHDAAP